MDKKQQAKLLSEIMEADARDGLYSSISKMETTQTAIQTLIAWGDEMLLKHPQKILSFAEVIDKAEELLQMEKEQIQKAFSDGQQTPMNHPTLPHYSREEYYNDTYGK